MNYFNSIKTIKDCWVTLPQGPIEFQVWQVLQIANDHMVFASFLLNWKVERPRRPYDKSAPKRPDTQLDRDTHSERTIAIFFIILIFVLSCCECALAARIIRSSRPFFFCYRRFLWEKRKKEAHRLRGYIFYWCRHQKYNKLHIQDECCTVGDVWGDAGPSGAALSTDDGWCTSYISDAACSLPGTTLSGGTIPVPMVFVSTSAVARFVYQHGSRSPADTGAHNNNDR